MTWETPLTEKFGTEGFYTESFGDQIRLVVPQPRQHEVLAHLKTASGFDFLVDVTAVDYLEYPEAADRFAVIYCLLNTVTGERLIVKVYVNDPNPTVKSVYDLWRGSDWLEREVYDMFGIIFEGHPDLRRILMPEEFTAFPLRKDYPLRGYGERHNFPVITRAES